MKDTKGQNGPDGKIALILSRNISSSEYSSYNNQTEWEFLVVQGSYRAAAEILSAKMTVLVTDGSVTAPPELLRLAMQYCSAVIPVDSSACAMEAAMAAIAGAESQTKSDNTEANDINTDTKSINENNSDSDTVENHSPYPDEEAVALEKVAAKSDIRPVRRQQQQQQRQQKLFDQALDPGELLSPDEIKALLGDADQGDYGSAEDSAEGLAENN